MRSTDETFGLTDTNLIDYGGVRILPALLPALTDLATRAEQEGFELGVASAFRSFERQREIWNEKASGARDILGDNGLPLQRDSLTDEETVFAILRWSALPGASRHHWGTDIDVYDVNPTKRGYRLQLTVEETTGNGIFGAFHQWLSETLAQPRCPFFRPYLRAKGGIAPEPWHLSFAPAAADFQQSLSKSALVALIEGSDLALREIVLANFDEIYDRFVWVPWDVYPVAILGARNAGHF